MQDVAALLAEGEARLAAGDWDGAAAIFQRAVAAAPDSPVAHSKLGIAYAHRRQWEDARTEFSRAIELDPHYAPAHCNLGNVHREQGRPREAIACYERAILIDPDYWIAHQNLGVVYKEQGRIDDAIREFKVSARLSLRAKPADGTRAARMGRAPGGRFGCLGAGARAALIVATVSAALTRLWGR